MWALCSFVDLQLPVVIPPLILKLSLATLRGTSFFKKDGRKLSENLLENIAFNSSIRLHLFFPTVKTADVYYFLTKFIEKT
jgi:hypothetical protein